MLPLIAELAGTSLNDLSPQQLTAMLETLHSLELPLRPRTELVIDKMCYCERIDGFGRYKPLDPNHHFQASLQGRTGELVQVYVELSNLSSLQRDSLFEINLASSVKIYRAAGTTPVWHHDFKDRDRHIRTWTMTRDFFNPYSFYVPAHLPPGDYRLVIQVIDLPTGRKAERSLPFHVTTIPDRDF
jgi:hypothetical protein